MGVLALTSPGGSPGVTTTALALALTWPRPVLLAECDPAGGSVLSGLWRGQSDEGGAALPLRLALAAERDPAAAAGVLRDEALFLGGSANATLLPSAPGPDAGRQLAGAWPALATVFALAGTDVIADLGRYGDTGELDALLATASRVLMVLRPSLRQAAAARPRLKTLGYVRPADGLVLIGPGDYSPDTLARQFDVPVAGTLPEEPQAAAVLSDGAPPGRRFMASRLMQAAQRLGGELVCEMDTQPVPVLPAEARQR